MIIIYHIIIYTILYMLYHTHVVIYHIWYIIYIAMYHIWYYVYHIMYIIIAFWWCSRIALNHPKLDRWRRRLGAAWTASWPRKGRSPGAIDGKEWFMMVKECVKVVHIHIYIWLLKKMIRVHSTIIIMINQPTTGKRTSMGLWWVKNMSINYSVHLTMIHKLW